MIISSATMIMVGKRFRWKWGGRGRGKTVAVDEPGARCMGSISSVYSNGISTQNTKCYDDDSGAMLVPSIPCAGPDRSF